MRFALFLVLWCGLSGSRLAAENWPQFRGPDGQGHTSATSLPAEWSDTQNIAWKQDIPGEGWSTPIVWDNRVFLTTSVPGQANEFSLNALCLSGDTGKVLWNREVFKQTPKTAQRIHSKNSHASPTPVTDGKHLFIHFGALGTACLTLEGDIVWKNDDLDYSMVHGSGGSPVLVEDLLVFSCDGAKDPFVVALDQKTGEIRWKKDRPPVSNPKKFSFTTPLVIEVKGEKQIISPASDLVAAYRPKDGEKIWSVEYEGYSVIPRPVYAEGLVFISTSYNNPVAMAISPEGTGDLTGNIAWKIRRAAPHTPSMLVVGSEVYMMSDKGIATCADAKTGKIHWQERIGGNYSASPLYGDGKIYFQSEEGVGTVIRPGKTFEEVAKNDLKSRTLASYAVIGSDLLIRTESALYRITAK